MNPALQKRLERCSSLPTLPAVAVKVIAECRADEPDILAIAQTLSNDPGLAAKLLRAVNSPSLGRGKRVSTVRNAIELLGLNAVRTLALSFSIAQGLKKNQKHGFRSFWKRSAIASVAARAIAVSHKVCEPEAAFLASLMQDIGILALGQIAEKRFDNLTTKHVDEHAALRAFERQQFECEHAEVGAWLTSHWRLPVGLSVAIRFSDEPNLIPQALDADTAAMAKTVALSGLVADIWVREDADVATRVARDAALSLLGVSGAAFAVLLAEIGDKMQEVAGFLDVQIGTRTETDAILEQARDALAELSMQSMVTVESARRTISELEQRERELLMAAQRDALTNLGNRGFLDSFLARCFDEACTTKQPLSIVMIDLDRFKSVNDTRGHQTGDAVIVATAGLLAAGIRPLDLAGRYGGEEFMLVLPATDAAGARAAAERIRAKLADLEIATPTGPIRVTASFGCATLDGPAVLRRVTIPDLVAVADRALYQAKRDGRNRVEQGAFEVPAGGSPALVPGVAAAMAHLG